MSEFLINILKYEVLEDMSLRNIKGNKLEKNFEDGSIVVLRKIDFNPLSYTDVPAYLPTYVIDIDNEQEEQKASKKKNKKVKK